MNLLVPWFITLREKIKAEIGQHKYPYMQSTHGYKTIRHRSQQKLRKLARRPQC